MSESARSILRHLYEQGRMTEWQYDKIDRNLKEPDRPHGEWVECEDKRYCECSNCWVLVTKKEAEDFGYCPKCGSDNRKRGDEEC